MQKFRILFLILLIAINSFTFAQKELVLEKVTVVSRHNVRAPLEKYMNTLDEMIGDGYQWMRWSVPGGNLTLRGDAFFFQDKSGKDARIFKVIKFKTMTD